MTWTSAEFLLAMIGSLVAAVGALGALQVSLANAKKVREEAESRRLENQQLETSLTALGMIAQETKTQVTNSHGTNLRDDLDAVSSTLCRVWDMLGVIRDNHETLDNALRGIRRDVGRLADADLNIRDSASREHQMLWKAINDRRTDERRD